MKLEMMIEFARRNHRQDMGIGSEISEQESICLGTKGSNEQMKQHKTIKLLYNIEK